MAGVERRSIEPRQEFSMDPGIPEFISVPDLARRTGRDHTSLVRAVRAGSIPAVKLGGKWLVPVSFVRQLESAAYGDHEVGGRDV